MKSGYTMLVKKIQDFTNDPRFQLIRQLNAQILKHPFDPSVSIDTQRDVAKLILPKSTGRMVVPTVYGFRLIIDLAQSHAETMQGSIERNLYILGTYEAGTLEIIRRSLMSWGKGATFVDVGAHNGLMSIYAALIGGATKVLSFEPNPPMFEMLKANLELNNCTNVTPFGLALGDKRGTASIAIDTENSGAAHITTPEHAAEHTVSIDTLDHVAKTNGLDHINLMLMDVEGYENNVLIGAEKMLSTHKPDLIIEYDPNDRDSRVTDILQRHGYKVYILEHSRHLPSRLVPFKITKGSAQKDNYFCFQPERAKALDLT